ncbi:DUF485 domain-containing protein [Streptomyces sp. 142MFCol3.1]|uniref:DUF485 domain-containing protein n=1 Tax=Streptomyces sp. 142MFCol3.1 TaxID=1172179 RepID=UPI0004295424|nr:DUF485 domain-containing protein [Streptomyces sp. 142MFCol3.1]
MPDAFSSPEYQPPHPRPFPTPAEPPYQPRHQRPRSARPPTAQPPSPQQPQQPQYPLHAPHPNSFSPTHFTYPWQPPPAQHAPEPRRMPRRQALGHHSDIRLLRGAYRWQRRVATLTALGYFVLFLTLSAFAPSLMTNTVSGGLSTGLLLGLLQVPVTCLAIGLYEYTARRTVDPIADRIRKQTELDARREAAR